MGILLGFAPYIVFALLTGLSISLGLWLAFAAAFVNTVRDFVESPTLRLLDAGSLILFGALALFFGFIEPELSFGAVRLVVDAGFFSMALASLVLRRPMTLDYGHEHLDAALVNTPRFRRIHYVLTMVWALAFALMTAAEAATILHPGISQSLGLAASLAALGLAVIFTLRYPAELTSAGHKHARTRQ